ncbi:MAG: hypothetical protein QOE92_2098 [Chloroflexota bacterium]|jgi:hypothetical protein|nr:hypothetical protein [Chloroflexota bacterium]
MDDRHRPATLPLAVEPPRSFRGLGRAGAASLLAIGLVTGGGVGGYIVATAATVATPAALAAPTTYATMLSAPDTPAAGDAAPAAADAPGAEGAPPDGCDHDGAVTQAALY